MTAPSAPPPVSLEAFEALVGQVQPPSHWEMIDQDRIDAFSRVSGDHQYIHTDPVRAAATGYGGTIAHGYLTLSLLSALHDTVLPPVAGLRMRINYGLNKVRFPVPVAVGKRVRGHFLLQAVERRSGGQVQTTTLSTIEIEGEAKPALVAERLALLVL